MYRAGEAGGTARGRGDAQGQGGSMRGPRRRDAGCMGPGRSEARGRVRVTCRDGEAGRVRPGGGDVRGWVGGTCGAIEK